MGILTDETLKTIAPETAVEYLEQLDTYYFGGSYWDGKERWGSGRVIVDF